MNRGLPILMYHLVAPASPPGFSKYTVSVKSFARQMHYLRFAGYTPITLDSLLAGRKSGTRLPSRPVVITFDDGFRRTTQYALPVLGSYGFTATFYLVAGLAGKTSRWLAEERGVKLKLIDWDEARRLEDQGQVCAAHSMTHPHLADLSAQECFQELIGSKLALEEQLGHEVPHMAYPFGSYDERVRALAAEAGYTSACSVRIGLSSLHDDPLALRRVPVTGQDTLLDFACRLRTAWPLGPLLHGKIGGMRTRLLAPVGAGKSR